MRQIFVSMIPAKIQFAIEKPGKYQYNTEMRN